jgi:hypothetical protein
MIKKWLPPVFYLAVFFILCPYLPRHFSSHFFTDTGDGLMMIWNVWWMNKAVCTLWTWPWFTSYLYFPDGVSLLSYVLTPFNGFLGIFLLKIFTLVQTFNIIVVFSFVMGGVTAFWLCRELTGSYMGSLVGGAVFTFSNYHFMHAEGHLTIASLEWVPFFVLCWIRFCATPRLRKGLMASLALFLVFLCDYYLFFYCVMTAVLFFLWMALKKRDVFYLFRGTAVRGLAGFAVSTLLTCGAFVAAVIYGNIKDPVSGAHSSRDFSMDLLSPFVWGPHWRFREWVEPLWRPLCATQGENESSVYLGLSVIALLIFVWKKRSTIHIPYFNFWCLLGAFFFVMSLGPNLHIGGREIDLGFKFHYMGKEVNPLLLPYAFLWLVFPPLRMSGVPIRMMLMVQLVAAILVAGGFLALLNIRSRWKYAAIPAFLIVLFFEYLPTPIPLTKVTCPAYVTALKNLPDGPVLDLASPPRLALYFQTVHEKKMGLGDIYRTTASREKKAQYLRALIYNGKWEQIARDFRITYVAKGDSLSYIEPGERSVTVHCAEIAPDKKVFDGGGVSIYRLAAE